MKDGTVEMDVISLSNIKNTVKGIILEAFPVGTIISNITGVNPSEYIGGTWEEVAKGRTLQGEDYVPASTDSSGNAVAESGHKAGTEIEAGLPNITGSWAAGWRYVLPAAGFDMGNNVTGAFYQGSPSQVSNERFGITDENVNNTNRQNYGYPWFDASRSNKIYGNSNTVQPPAYVVHFYKRTA